MNDGNRFGIVLIVIACGVLVQIGLLLAQCQDTPNQAAVNYARAYYKFDPQIADMLCEEIRSQGGLDQVDKFIYQARKEAGDRGYGIYLLKNKLYNVKTKTISRAKAKIEIRVIADRKPPLKSFFSHEAYKVDEIITVTQESGRWKVCGGLFNFTENSST